MSGPAGPQAPQVMLAKTEMRGIADMFNRMADACYEKCIAKVGSDPSLHVGQMSCTDRCVSKYMEVHERVADVMKKVSDQQNAAAGAAGQMPGAGAPAPVGAPRPVG